uniref:Transcription factor 23 n=3 Tax=Nothobranchius TaxID=28779 RepID=A0A1A8S0D4_9TELE
MAVNPLEGLISVTVKQQLMSSSKAEQNQNQQHVHKKWLQTVCGSRSSCGSGSVVQRRSLRSQNSPENAARERSRVQNLRQAFYSLQAALPSVPPDTKLSKLDVLVLATNYIAHLTETLDQGSEQALPFRPGGYLHPVKKWPMRSLLYCGAVGELLSANRMPPPGYKGSCPLSPAETADVRIHD